MEENKTVEKIIVSIPTALVILIGGTCYLIGKSVGGKKEKEAYVEGLNDGMKLERKLKTLEETVKKATKKEEK